MHVHARPQLPSGSLTPKPQLLFVYLLLIIHYPFFCLVMGFPLRYSFVLTNDRFTIGLSACGPPLAHRASTLTYTLTDSPVFNTQTTLILRLTPLVSSWTTASSCSSQELSLTSVSLIPGVLCLSFSVKFFLYSFFKEKQKPKPSIVLVGSHLSLSLGFLILCFLPPISQYMYGRVVKKGTCSWGKPLSPLRAMDWFSTSVTPRDFSAFPIQYDGQSLRSKPSLEMLLLLAEIHIWRIIVSK